MNSLKWFGVAMIGLALGVFGHQSCVYLSENGLPFTLVAFLYVAIVIFYAFAVSIRIVYGKWFWR